MSKSKMNRKVEANQAMAYCNSIRTSPRKLNLVAQSIRGLSAEKAVAELSFSKKRIAKTALSVLQSAIANAAYQNLSPCTGASDQILPPGQTAGRCKYDSWGSPRDDYTLFLPSTQHNKIFSLFRKLFLAFFGDICYDVKASLGRLLKSLMARRCSKWQNAISAARA